jgi:hypothetical protein
VGTAVWRKDQASTGTQSRQTRQDFDDLRIPANPSPDSISSCSHQWAFGFRMSGCTKGVFGRAQHHSVSHFEQNLHVSEIHSIPRSLP